MARSRCLYAGCPDDREDERYCGYHIHVTSEEYLQACIETSCATEGVGKKPHPPEGAVCKEPGCESISILSSFYCDGHSTDVERAEAKEWAEYNRKWGKP